MSDKAKSLNINVLQRHDASIKEILDTTSYVVLYQHSDQWRKTGIEGTMFLFKRSRPPYHGLFILNRQGPQNFCQDLTDEEALELTDDFIIYSASSQNVYGFWVFEPAQRAKIGQRMQQLARTSIPQLPKEPAFQSRSDASTSQSINLDALFATGSKPGPAGTSLSQSQSQQDKTIDLIETIFKSAGNPPAPSTAGSATGPPRDASVVTFLSCFETVLLKLRKQSNERPTTDVAVHQPLGLAHPHAQHHQSEQHLLSLLGLQADLPRVPASAASSGNTPHAPTPAVAPPVPLTARPNPSPTSVPLSTLLSHSPASIPPQLSLSAFRRELLLHFTDDEFVQALYERYRSS